ncbi:MAG: 16S rRNA (cytosine(1402)-N(4))-methyltransferase RsmH [Alphaproteobacteria bacterium]|nr:16S rRNA (cytosine(1402)-N(4))-methyltransferase RsmH [Alphaproteobacteria bacterium]
MTLAERHIPVLLKEVIETLAPKDGGIYVDGTFGRGGYTRAILEAAKTKVIAIDRDPDALSAGQSLAERFAPRLTLVQGPFGAMDVLLAGEHLYQVDGIVLDLGVSSPQLDEPERGFSFNRDGPLDMRMSRSGPTAADIVNGTDEKELADIIYTLGEERHARRVAQRIVEARTHERILRTGQLADIVRKAVPRSKDGLDPATRTFQALRIYVNDELNELNRALEAAEKILAPKGRLVVVSFHSLEDRIVKEFLRNRSGMASSGSRHLPTNDTDANAKPLFHLLSKKPIVPADEEIAGNPRAASAKLRAAERTEAPYTQTPFRRVGP